MEKLRLLLFSVVIEMLLIICVALANLNPTPLLYFIFYNFGYGLLCSFFVPLFLIYKEKNLLASVGIKKMGVRQFTVLFSFVVFSIGGQLFPQIAAGEEIPLYLLPTGIVPLIMTTFFEEFLFRGFVQSRMEKQFGWLAAIFVSGLMFSLYHLGYPRFRTLEDILLLFVVGMGFAIAYKLSGNNLIVSYFVNLPNAFVTYMLKYEQFPTMTSSSTIAGVVTLLVIVVIILKSRKIKLG